MAEVVWQPGSLFAIYWFAPNPYIARSMGVDVDELDRLDELERTE